MVMTNAQALRPIVLVPADNRMLGEHPFHVVGRKYVDAVRLAGCLPLVVPWAGADEVDELLAHADGVFLTGSPSNVHPSHFGEEVHDPALPLDPARDEWTLPLTRKALAHGVPMLAICRGLMSDPEMLLLDEPSLGLAPIIVKGVFDTIRRIRDEGGLETQPAGESKRSAAAGCAGAGAGA